uniref:RNA-directed DNA polymerase n=1 Tax=Fagus sylvatica TaxID=28930 RepID=A0A2N9G8V4_FAGSY
MELSSSQKLQRKQSKKTRKNPKFCYFHQYIHHSTADCWTLQRKFHEKIQDGTLELPQAQQKVHTDPFLMHKDKAVVSVIIHRNASDMDMDEPAAASTAMAPAAIKTLQRNPRFRSLFNQLGLNPEARTTATEAIMAISAESGAHCFTVETHASRAFLKTTNAITFTKEDMEVQYPDHRRPLYLSATINEVQVRRALVDTGSCINLIPLSTIQAAEISQKNIQGAPMEIKGFRGIGDYTKRHIQLVLKIGPIVALTRFHVVNSGRLNRKPIRIAANPTPFDQSESHFVEVALYDEVAPVGEASLAKPVGIPLPKWEDIKDAPEANLRDLLEQKRKRREEASTSRDQPQCPSCLTVNEKNGPESADAVAVESAAADPKISAKEELKQYDEMLGIDPELVTYSLNVELGTKPVVQPMRTFHPEVETQITQEVKKKLLAVGFIKPIQHPRWLSNIVPVKKKNGQIRCCVDFRNLNKACPKDEFPLPDMDLLIDSATGHAMFSFMDGFSGYNQIFMSPKDAEKTAFRTPIGNFYYIVMPFGLKNAGATYQRTMVAMFHDMMHCEIKDYVDDIVVKSKTKEGHFGILKKVFERCRLYKLKMNPLKCAFGVSAGKFLDFLVHQPGIDVDPARASTIATMKPPTTHKERELHSIGLPSANKTLKSQAIGALIAQEDNDGVEQPVYYVSRALKDAESLYSRAERSCLALIYASQRLRHYFLTHKVQLMTKFHPIRSLLQWPVLSSRLAHSSISDEVLGEINEVFLADMEDSTWTLRFDSSSTATSGGAGIVLYKGNGEAVTKSFKFNFPCSNNAAEYEAYLAGLAIAYEMGIKHLRVIGDSNLVVCQARGEFSLKEPSLVPYRALAQKLEAKFSTFETEHAQRNENQYADTLATLGSQIAFEGEEMDVTICKKMEPITELLKKEFEELSPDQEDWRAPIKAKLISLAIVANLRESKDYTLISRDLYRRLPEGVLARCINMDEAKKRLLEVHEKTYGDGVTISLYCRLQQLGYLWPSMSTEAADLQSQCPTCQFHHNNEEVCATFISTDWRTPFLEYLLEGILPPNPNDGYRLKRLALRYFVEGGTLFRKATPWPFHTWGLYLIGPINPASGGYIWILVATEYFTKWVKAILLRKATGAAVTNFVQEHIITRFGIPYKLISDNGTPFINKDVREVLKYYQVKHRHSTPYYPQGNGQAEATNRTLLRILSKMVFDYGNDWKAHLANVLWAYRGSPKIATGFTPFSLVYGTDTICPTELVVPSPRVMQWSELEVDANMYAEARIADLEGLDEARELAKAKSQRNYQKMANVYNKTLRVRVFVEGQMVLKAAEFVRRGLPSPSKFSPNWDGPYIIRKAHGSGYYRLSKSDGTILADPINGKWPKHYYS